MKPWRLLSQSLRILVIEISQPGRLLCYSHWHRLIPGGTAWSRMCPNCSAGWPACSCFRNNLFLGLFDLRNVFDLTLLHKVLFPYILHFLQFLLFFIGLFWVIFLKFPLRNSRIYYIFVRTFSGDV